MKFNPFDSWIPAKISSTVNFDFSRSSLPKLSSAVSLSPAGGSKRNPWQFDPLNSRIHHDTKVSYCKFRFSWKVSVYTDSLFRHKSQSFVFFYIQLICIPLSAFEVPHKTENRRKQYQRHGAASGIKKKDRCKKKRVFLEPSLSTPYCSVFLCRFDLFDLLLRHWTKFFTYEFGFVLHL